MSAYAKGGYLDQKRRDPLSLGAAVAINGALIGALVFMNPGVGKQFPKIFETIRITEAPPPDPIEPIPPKEMPKEQQVAQRDPIVSSHVPIDLPETRFTPPPLPPIPPVIPGTGTTIFDPPVPPPPPSVFIGAKVNPRYAADLQPAYPAGKIRAEQEGVVTVRVLVGPDGRVKQVQRVSATDDVFYRATEEQALRRWRFVPATRDGVAVESWETKTVRFRLSDL